MNNSESWKWKGIKEKGVLPKAVCVFCKFCIIDKDTESWREIYDHNLLCKKHPTQKTINPITGHPAYAYWKTFDEVEDYGRKPTLTFVGQEFRYCYDFNK